MRLYCEDVDYKLYHGNMLDMLDIIQPNSIDSIVTDPPYELGFMAKSWDKSGIAFQKETWEKCFKVLKSGGYLLAFGGSRTFHRIACAIEDAGFEIRDTIMWLYGSGFPKSFNIGLAIDKKNGVESEILYEKYSVPHSSDLYNVGENAKYDRKIAFEKKAKNEWDGWGTQLKPAYEPIIVARKPIENTIVDNVLKYGVGGLNIDECRVKTNDDLSRINKNDNGMFGVGNNSGNTAQICKELGIEYGGRFPANVILTYDETDKEEVCGGMPNTSSNESVANYERSNNDNITHLYTNIKSGTHYEDEGSASRYFYCAKASLKDRDEGMDSFEIIHHSVVNNRKEGSAGLEKVYGSGTNPYLAVGSPRRNIHPTIKPVDLMQYLIRLVSPKGATILDCFMGSGSTGKAVMFENRERNANYKFIGIELTDEYLPICKARINYGKYKYEYDLKHEQAESLRENGFIQQSIFDI